MVFGDGTLNIKYYQNAFTPEMEEEQERVRSGQSAGQMLKTMLIPLIAEWDITYEAPVMIDDPDNEGKKIQARDKNGNLLFTEEVIPIDNAGLNMVPIRVLTEIVKKISEDVTPGEEQNTNSEGTFSRTGG